MLIGRADELQLVRASILARLNLLKDQSEMTKRYEGLFGKDYLEALKRQDRAKAGAVLVLDDHIVEIGTRVNVPKDAVVVDLTGLHLWPGLVEPYSDLGAPKGDRTKEEKLAGARFWNPAIRASTRADVIFSPDEDRAAALRAAPGPARSASGTIRASSESARAAVAASNVPPSTATTSSQSARGRLWAASASNSASSRPDSPRVGTTSSFTKRTATAFCWTRCFRGPDMTDS